MQGYILRVDSFSSKDKKVEYKKLSVLFKDGTTGSYIMKKEMYDEQGIQNFEYLDVATIKGTSHTFFFDDRGYLVKVQN